MFDSAAETLAAVSSSSLAHVARSRSAARTASFCFRTSTENSRSSRIAWSFNRCTLASSAAPSPACLQASAKIENLTSADFADRPMMTVSRVARRYFSMANGSGSGSGSGMGTGSGASLAIFMRSLRHCGASAPNKSSGNGGPALVSISLAAAAAALVAGAGAAFFFGAAAFFGAIFGRATASDSARRDGGGDSARRALSFSSSAFAVPYTSARLCCGGAGR